MTTLPTRSARNASPVAFRAIQLMTPRPMSVAPTSRARTFAAAGVERPNPASIDSRETNRASPNTTAATPPIIRARRGLTARREYSRPQPGDRRSENRARHQRQKTDSLRVGTGPRVSYSREDRYGAFAAATPGRALSALA